MFAQGAFDLGSSQTVSRYVDNIIDPTGNPVETIIITTAAVTREVITRKHRKIGLMETLMVTIQGSHHAGPGEIDAQVTCYARYHRSIYRFHPPVWGCTPKKGRVAEPGLVLIAPGRGVIRIPPVSRLPPGIDDGTFFLADDLEIPVPFGALDRLTYRTEHFQGRKVTHIRHICRLPSSGLAGQSGAV